MRDGAESRRTGAQTKGAAQAAGFSGIGMLAPGYHADFAVLDRDILEIPAEKIDQVRVAETYMDGVCIYKSEEK